MPMVVGDFIIHTWVKMEENVDKILIAPCNLQLVLVIVRHDFLSPSKVAHPGQVHKHDARIHTGLSVIRMAGKPVIPDINKIHTNFMMIQTPGESLTT